MGNKHYIIILSMVLIAFYVGHNFFYIQVEDFTKVEAYSFEDEKNTDIVKDCRDAYDQLGEKIAAEKHILNLIQFIQLSEYLIYEDRMDARVYYDLTKSILSSKNRDRLNKSESFEQETNKYLNRKRKTGLKYIQYEVAMPVFYHEEGHEYGSVVVKRQFDSGNTYLKYKFIYENKFWYFEEVTSIDKINERVEG